MIRQDPIHFFRHGSIITSQPCLYMCDRNVELLKKNLIHQGVVMLTRMNQYFFNALLPLMGATNGTRNGCRFNELRPRPHNGNNLHSFSPARPIFLNRFDPDTIFLITPPAGFADRFPRPKGDPLCALTDPPFHFPWISIDQCIIWDIIGHHRISPDKGILTDLIATDDRGIRPDGGPFSAYGFSEFLFSRYKTSRVEDIGKDHRRATKDVVLQYHSIIDRDIILDLNMISQNRPCS